MKDDTIRQVILSKKKVCMRPVVYGIGNPLMDIVVSATDLELASLGLKKGIMYLISEHVRKRLISFIETRHRFYSCGGSAPNTIIALTTFGKISTSSRNSFGGKGIQDRV
jgi:hypothetical protein